MDKRHDRETEMLKAIIFDFDGVVSDSEPLHYKAFAGALAQYGFCLTEDLYYADYVGYCDRECFENVIKNFPDQLADTDIEKLLEIKTLLFEKIIDSGGNIIDGVEEFLSIIKSADLRIAICSGATLCDIELMLNGSNIKHYFETIVSDDDVSRGKPHPEGYSLALARLNEKADTAIKPAECIVIEDSHWGLEAAIAAGMHTIAVTNTYHPEQLSIADKVVKNLGDITIDELYALA